MLKNNINIQYGCGEKERGYEFIRWEERRGPMIK